MQAAKPATRARTSKLLVIDASVMRAAGGVSATDPVPAHARDVLISILEVCHRVCLSPDLGEEWKRHQSRFARSWLTRMYARRKVIPCQPKSCQHLIQDISSFPTTTGPEIAAVEKDIHLVAAALTTPDRTILSWDNRVAAVIRKVCADTRTVTNQTIARVLWINPITDHGPLQAWLSETGIVQPHWPLGGASTPDTATGRWSARRSKKSP